MTDRANPLGVECFEFCEFSAPDASMLHALFKTMGFTAVGHHKSLKATLYRQGGINFVVNEEPKSFAAQFSEQHGPGCPSFAIRVANPEAAAKAVVAKGAKRVERDDLVVDSPVIEGIGGALLFLTDGLAPLEQAFEPIPGVDQNPKGDGLAYVDHLTHNVFDGNMDQWATFYSDYFGFFEVKYFDIKGQQTGLRSRAMSAPNGAISIPINESSDPKSQINEYLNEYKGEGVQHIALYTNDIYATIESMRERNVDFMPTPDTYYEIIDKRIPEHGEDIARMKENRILIDAEPNDSSKQLLQIFTKTNIGPLFFEIIQRKGNEGFGEGNFQALFESIELDQMRRGVL